MGQQETYNEWFRRGMWLGKSDSQRGKNEGLSDREIRALNEENSRPWGQKMFAEGFISDRAKKAQKQAKAKQAKARRTAAAAKKKKK
jgi:hypothetical protein